MVRFASGGGPRSVAPVQDQPLIVVEPTRDDLWEQLEPPKPSGEQPYRIVRQPANSDSSVLGG